MNRKQMIPPMPSYILNFTAIKLQHGGVIVNLELLSLHRGPLEITLNVT